MNIKVPNKMIVKLIIAMPSEPNKDFKRSIMPKQVLIRK